MNRSHKHILAFVVLVVTALSAIGQVPPRPNPPRLVNDLAGVLPDADVLEDSLRAFDRNTSNQIVVVTLNDLGGMDRAMMAYEIGQQWGVGSAKNNNGVVILVKPKTEDSRGEAFIATGYGLEGALPDALCSQIVNREMIPSFKQGNYSNGVWAAVRVVEGLAQGEFNEQDYIGNDDEDDFTMSDFFSLVFSILFIIAMYYYLDIPFGGGGGFSGTWGGGSSSRSYGSSSSSSSSSWGGFGGGSFGGGGGGGSW